MYLPAHKKMAPRLLLIMIALGYMSNFIAMEEREDGSKISKSTGRSRLVIDEKYPKYNLPELRHRLTPKERSKDKIKEDIEEESESTRATSTLQSLVPTTPIYQGDATSNICFIPIAKATGGCSIATLYRLGQNQTRWIGKVGEESGLSKEDFATYRTTSRTRTKKAIALDTIREKIAADFYQALGCLMENSFITPQTCLSHQPVTNEYTDWNHFARARVETGVNSTLRIMSRFVDGYQDFADAWTELDGRPVRFIKYVEHCHQPPEALYVTYKRFKGGKEEIELNKPLKTVPLLGMIEMCAAMRILADTDGLGGYARNAGFVWQRDKSGSITAARAVKIDPGNAFQFTLPDEGTSVNRVLNTKHEAGNSLYWFEDTRDIQVANSDMSVTLRWNSLTERQQQQFLDALDTMDALSESEKVLFFFFYRDGKFKRNESEEMPEEVARLLVFQMRQWIELQRKIYHRPLAPQKKKLYYPSPLDRFTGRQEQLKLLSRELIIDNDNKQVHVSALCGPSGIGKSELAKYFAFKHNVPYYFDLIFWLQADTEANLMLSYLDLAQVLVLPLDDKSNLETIRSAVYAALEQRKLRWLLIFDNAEQKILVPKKGGSVIITSQRKDLWRDHAIIELFPLTKKEIIEFLKREALGESIESMDIVAARCEGIPLVLSAMTGLIKQGSTIVQYLQQMGERDKTSQKTSFAIVWDFMFDQIKNQNAEAFEVLLLCAFFHPENIPVSWIGDYFQRDFTKAQLLERSLKIVKYLKSYNLIRFDSQRQVFSLHWLLHEVLRQYARCQEDSLSVKVLSFLVRSRNKFHARKEDQWQDSKLWSIHTEFFLSKQNNAAVVRGIKYEKLLLSLARFYKGLHNFSKAFDYNWRVLALRRQKHGKKHPKIAESLAEIGQILKLQRDYERAFNCYQSALEMWKSIDRKNSYFEIKNCLNEIAEIFHLLGKEAEASKYRDQSDEETIKYEEKELEELRKTHGEKPSERVAQHLDHVCFILELRSKYAEALPYRQQALQMYQKLHGEKPHMDVAKSLRSLSSVLNSLGRAAEASHYHQQAGEIELRCRAYDLEKQRHDRKDQADIAKSLEDMGTTLRQQGKFNEAMECCYQALAIYKEIPGKEFYVASCLVDIGNILDWQGKYGEALEAYKQARMNQLQKKEIDSIDFETELDSFLLDLENDNREMVDNKICSMLRKLSRDDEASQYEQELLAEKLEDKKQTLNNLQKSYGAEENPDVADCLTEIGDMLEALGNYMSALAHYRQALNMYRKIYGETAHWAVSSSLEKIGAILDLKGDKELALVHYQQVLEINRKLYGRSENVARSLDTVGHALYSQDKHKEASEYYQQAFQMRKKNSEEDLSLSTGTTLNNIGVDFYSQDNYDQALNYYHQALKIYQKVNGTDAQLAVATCLYNIGRALCSQDKYEEALKYYQQALEMQEELYHTSPNVELDTSIKDTERALRTLQDRQLALEMEDEQDHNYKLKTAASINAINNNTDRVTETKASSSLNKYHGIKASEPKKRCVLQ